MAFWLQAIAILVGVMYNRQQMDEVGVFNINGALFLLLTNMTFQNCSAVINVSRPQARVKVSERMSSVYNWEKQFFFDNRTCVFIDMTLHVFVQVSSSIRHLIISKKAKAQTKGTTVAKTTIHTHSLFHPTDLLLPETSVFTRALQRHVSHRRLLFGQESSRVTFLRHLLLPICQHHILDDWP